MGMNSSYSCHRNDISCDKKTSSCQKLNLFIGVEVTIQSICAAAVKLSVESDMESLVSRYEKHLKVDRQMEEENAEHEMEISENGPLLHHADNIIEMAMNKYGT